MFRKKQKYSNYIDANPNFKKQFFIFYNEWIESKRINPITSHHLSSRYQPIATHRMGKSSMCIALGK